MTNLVSLNQSHGLKAMFRLSTKTKAMCRSLEHLLPLSVQENHKMMFLQKLCNLWFRNIKREWTAPFLSTGRLVVERLILFLDHQSFSIFLKTSREFVQERSITLFKIRTRPHNYPSVVWNYILMIAMIFLITNAKYRLLDSVQEPRLNHMQLQLSLVRVANGFHLTQKTLLVKMLKESKKNLKQKVKYTNQYLASKKLWKLWSLLNQHVPLSLTLLTIDQVVPTAW